MSTAWTGRSAGVRWVRAAGAVRSTARAVDENRALRKKRRREAGENRGRRQEHRAGGG
jgi:hypothetical protein